MRRTAQLITAALLTAGCARTTPMALGPDHPADPDAAAAPAPVPSTVLAVSAPPATVPAQAEAAPAHGGHGTGHGQHDAHRGPPSTTEARP